MLREKEQGLPAAKSQAVEAFIARWAPSQAAERANKDSFLNELCDLLEVARPGVAGAGGDYVFEFPVPNRLADGRATTHFADLEGLAMLGQLVASGQGAGRVWSAPRA